MRALDWVILLAYVGIIVGIAARASRGRQTVASHLRADRSLPAWAVVFSVLATEVSAATYIGVPERAFKGNWNYLEFAFGSLLGKLVLATFFIRLYWRLNLPTVYGLLGQRIGPMTQRATAFAFLGGRLIASGVRMFIAALAFSLVTGISIWAAIGAMALLSTAYTFIGGLRAVVWTDVAQGVVFFVGAATALIVGLSRLSHPVADVIAQAFDAGKLQVFTLSDDGLGWFASTRPWPVAILGGFFLVLASHGTDQENVQQLLGSKSEKASGRSIFLSGLCTFPIVALFLSVGTMLWAFHREFPPTAYDLADPEQARRVFPLFIMHVLPTGVRGLVFAGLFAAAISSLGATLNAAATAWVSDLVPRPAQSDAAGLRRVRFLTVVFGLLLACVALAFDWYAKRSTYPLVDLALSSMTILYGGILGVFLVALIWRTRGSDSSTFVGLSCGVALGAVVFFHPQLMHVINPDWPVSRRVLEWPWSLPLCVAVTMAVAACGRRAVLPPPLPAVAAGGSS